MKCDPRLVHVRSGLQVVDHSGEQTVRGWTRFDGALAGSRPIHCQKTNPVWQDGAKTFGQVFFAAVESVDRDNDWHGTLCVLRQTQVADNVGAFERNVYDFQRRVSKLRVP